MRSLMQPSISVIIGIKERDAQGNYTKLSLSASTRDNYRSSELPIYTHVSAPTQRVPHISYECVCEKLVAFLRQPDAKIETSNQEGEIILNFSNRPLNADGSLYKKLICTIPNIMRTAYVC